MAKNPVGMIGLGIMGSAMSANLVRAGFRVLGYDVVAQRRDEHRKAGGDAARDSRELAKRCDMVVTSLPSAQALLDTASELAKTSRKGQIVVETSTLPIAVKEEAKRVLAARGTILLDCTLSGTGAQARVKDLIVYASGDRKSYDRITGVLEGFARAHYFVGEFGAGSKVKFVANLLVAIHNVAAAEAMVLAMKSGLDPALVLKVVADGAGSSRMLQVRGPMMVKGDYSEATMKVETWQKDMTIIGEYARKIDCPTPLFSASSAFYTAAMAMGYGAADTGVVCKLLERMANYSR
jgi:3-hydroxyisobutyrate dehydrogenase-like beta-hydroxyacid dehydrogenase